MTDNATSKEGCYRIGVVSRMTGIEPVTLRAWERRYGVVEPERTPGGGRLYSQNDISRLALLKRLVDEGHAIGAIAQLPTEQLNTLNEPVQAAAGGRPQRLVGCGFTLPAWLKGDVDDPKLIDVPAIFSQFEQFEAEAAGLEPDVIVLEYPTIHEETVLDVSRLLRLSGAARAVVIYGFGRSAAVDRLDNDTIMPLRAPLRMADLRRLLEPPCPPAARLPPAVPQTEPSSPPLPPRYDRFTLGKLARQHNGIQCECPQHLAELLISLNGFERYSAECDSRSPDDAALHRYLIQTTARARALLEEALAQVILAEDLDI